MPSKDAATPPPAGDPIAHSPSIGFDWRLDAELRSRIAFYDRILLGLSVIGVLGTIAFALMVFAS